jgi:hypothetical protein
LGFDISDEKICCISASKYSRGLSSRWGREKEGRQMNSVAVKKSIRKKVDKPQRILYLIFYEYRRPH